MVSQRSIERWDLQRRPWRGACCCGPKCGLGPGCCVYHNYTNTRHLCIPDLSPSLEIVPKAFFLNRMTSNVRKARIPVAATETRMGIYVSGLKLHHQPDSNLPSPLNIIPTAGQACEMECCASSHRVTDTYIYNIYYQRYIIKIPACRCYDRLSSPVNFLETTATTCPHPTHSPGNRAGWLLHPRRKAHTCENREGNNEA